MVLEERRMRVNLEIRDSLALSYRIVDRIHEILEEKGLKQKDLAQRLGKSGAENHLLSTPLGGEGWPLLLHSPPIKGRGWGWGQ